MLLLLALYLELYLTQLTVSTAGDNESPVPYMLPTGVHLYQI